jgi:DNA-binding CsgD family transcriptional regulator
VRFRGRSISRLGPGEFVGEMSLLDYGTRSATVIAETPMRVLSISPRDFAALLNQPAVARRVASQLARRLRDTWTGMTHEPPTGGWHDLTEAEARVARLAADGLTNKEIAADLHLSRHTVDSHLRRTFAKLQISSRVELANRVASWPKP